MPITRFPLLAMLWQKLKTISKVEFESRSLLADQAWHASGSGRVLVECPHDNCITFNESGSWLADSGTSLNFSNRYRWQRTESDDLIRLQHLRYGETRPVALVELLLQPDLSWQSPAPHICKDDTYHAEIALREDGLLLEWTISGPTKSELLSCIYS